MTHDALRSGGESPPDLGFFTDPATVPTAAAPAAAGGQFGTPVASGGQFGTPVGSGGQFGTPVSAGPPFGSVVRTPDLPAAPAAGPVATHKVLLVGLLVVALLGAVGVVTFRAWKKSGAPPQTTVSTPPVIGTLSRAALSAPDLARLQPDLATAVRLQAPHLATYTGGAVSAQVLVVQPVEPMVAGTQSQVLTAVTAGLERITGIPPQLSPVMAGVSSLLSPFGCSQIELGSDTPVFCAGTSSGAVTLMLVSGEDYAAATHTAADLRAAVVHRD